MRVVGLFLRVIYPISSLVNLIISELTVESSGNRIHVASFLMWSFHFYHSSVYIFFILQAAEIKVSMQQESISV